MPYYTNKDLPPSISHALPPQAQDFYRIKFNNAWEEHGNPAQRAEGESCENLAHRLAWEAVKKKYQLDGEPLPEREDDER